MIIQIRGTSGSGKTTAMRAIMSILSNLPNSTQSPLQWIPQYTIGRQRPLYYFLQGKSVVVLGHYEISCGGCDTIGSVPDIFSVIRTLPEFKVILCEGLLLSEDVRWSVNGRDVRALFLTTPSEECLRRVSLRQEERGHQPKDPARVRRKLLARVDTIERARLRLVQAGIVCRRVPVEQAVSLAVNWIQPTL